MSDSSCPCPLGSYSLSSAFANVWTDRRRQSTAVPISESKVKGRVYSATYSDVLATFADMLSVFLAIAVEVGTRNRHGGSLGVVASYVDEVAGWRKNLIEPRSVWVRLGSSQRAFVVAIRPWDGTFGVDRQVQ
jgi:hypothetical protein